MITQVQARWLNLSDLSDKQKCDILDEWVDPNGLFSTAVAAVQNVVRKRRKRSPAALPPKKDSGCSCPSPGLYPSCDSAGQQYSLWDSQMLGPSTCSTKSAQATSQRALAKEILCLSDSPGGPPAQGSKEEKAGLATRIPQLHSWAWSRVWPSCGVLGLSWHLQFTAPQRGRDIVYLAEAIHMLSLYVSQVSQIIDKNVPNAARHVAEGTNFQFSIVEKRCRNKTLCHH